MNEPAMPSPIVIGMLIGSLPGKRQARQRAEDEALDGEDDEVDDQAHARTLPGPAMSFADRGGVIWA